MFTLTFWARRGALAPSSAMARNAADLMRR